MLEFDHIRPVALGGTSTVDDLRVACKAHNLFAAEQIFGREYMAQFLRRPAAEASPSGAREISTGAVQELIPGKAHDA
jgi:hypothetical protein